VELRAPLGRTPPEAVASVGLGEDGSRREQTFGELSDEVTRLAEALVRLGVREGDRVAIFLPMSPRCRWRRTPVRTSGRSRCRSSPASRRRPSPNGSRPRGQGRDHDARFDAPRARGTDARDPRGGARDAPSVEHVVVAPWDELVADSSGELPAAELDSEAPYLLTYTSGTTGTPKASSTSRAASSSRSRARSATRRRGPDDRIHFVTDMGWIMGPWTVVGGHAMGSTLVFAEGRPTGRRPLWKLIDSEQVSGARISPTLTRALIPHGEPADRPLVAADDRHHGRAVEPRAVPLAVRGGRRRTLPDHQLLRRDGGRCVLPVADARDPDQGVLARRAALGMAMDVVDSDGQLRAWRGRRARLPQAVPRDDAWLLARPERYVDTYWRRFPGIWTHGDWASVDEDGYWFLHGRSDDTLNIAGKRIGPGGARVGRGRPPIRGRGCGDRRSARREGRGGLDLLRRHARDRGRRRARGRGCSSGCSRTWARRSSRSRDLRVRPAEDTSAKIVRRAVRAQALGSDPGDLSSLENPESLEEIANAV
jgi:acetyl-CoA synthetase